MEGLQKSYLMNVDQLTMEEPNYESSYHDMP
jgi:hypothetical protein